MHQEEMSAAALEASRVIRSLKQEVRYYRTVSAIFGLGLLFTLVLLMLTI